MEVSSTLSVDLAALLIVGVIVGGQQATASDSKIIFSGRHEGLAFYFARLIRPIWKLRVTRLA